MISRFPQFSLDKDLLLIIKFFLGEVFPLNSEPLRAMVFCSILRTKRRMISYLAIYKTEKSPLDSTPVLEISSFQLITWSTMEHGKRYL